MNGVEDKSVIGSVCYRAEIGWIAFFSSNVSACAS